MLSFLDRVPATTHTLLVQEAREQVLCVLAQRAPVTCVLRTGLGHRRPGAGGVSIPPEGLVELGWLAGCCAGCLLGDGGTLT